MMVSIFLSSGALWKIMLSLPKFSKLFTKNSSLLTETLSSYTRIPSGSHTMKLKELLVADPPVVYEIIRSLGDK
jgi:hypothetical protein